MSKAVLLSVRPKYCELIANGEKTVEVRKTRPKLETPFKCYIYCTMPKKHFSVGGGLTFSSDDLYRSASGKIKYGNSLELMCYDGCTKDNFLNGKVIGEFVCRNIDTISPESFIVKEDALIALTGTCLTIQSAKEYARWKHGTPIYECKDIFGWHISDLVIYDEPKELGEFYKYGYCEAKREVWGWTDAEEASWKITRPPQSWCYVEELC